MKILRNKTYKKLLRRLEKLELEQGFYEMKYNFTLEALNKLLEITPKLIEDESEAIQQEMIKQFNLTIKQWE